MAFYFEGEFSIIADPSGGDMSERLVDAKKGIEAMIGTMLAPGSVSVSADGEILAWFSCNHELVVPSIPVASTPSKSMSDPAMNATSEKEPTPSVQPTAEVTVKQEVSSDHIPPKPETRCTGIQAGRKACDGLYDVWTITKRFAAFRKLGAVAYWDRRHRFFPGLRTVV
ncbi:hypothetical protein K474DRAFT_274570 [Panus rudis PR-1116 ss-1]|nr:hypothetical protein K474DRAFT_274570 [Panus rudis PR-1116 ss-1]